MYLRREPAIDHDRSLTEKTGSRTASRRPDFPFFLILQSSKQCDVPSDQLHSQPRSRKGKSSSVHGKGKLKWARWRRVVSFERFTKSAARAADICEKCPEPGYFNKRVGLYASARLLLFNSLHHIAMEAGANPPRHARPGNKIR